MRAHGCDGTRTGKRVRESKTLAQGGVWLRARRCSGIDLVTQEHGSMGTQSHKERIQGGKDGSTVMQRHEDMRPLLLCRIQSLH